jgi:hypothetical protein
MVATFAWHEFNGAGKDESGTLTNGNWGAVDDHDLDIAVEANKIARGSNSYTKYIVGHFSGVYTTIGPNGKLWKSAGTLGAGLAVKAVITNTYATPSTVASGDSDIPVLEVSALTVQFGADPEDATNNSDTSNPCYTGYYRSQLQTTGSAATGTIGAQTLTLRYDES